MAQILIHPTATGPAAIARLEAETGRVAVLAGMAAELVFISLEEQIIRNQLASLDEMRAQINGGRHA